MRRMFLNTQNTLNKTSDNNYKINIFIISLLLFLISNGVLCKTKTTKSKTTAPSNIRSTVATRLSTTSPKTTESPRTTTTKVQYPALDFVNGLKTCKDIQSKDPCKKLCGKLKRAYEKSLRPPSEIPYYLSGSYLLVLSVVSLILWFKFREMTKDHTGELDLNGLSRRERIKANMLNQPDPDAASSKFKKRGGVVIATNLDRAFKKRCEEEKEDVEMGTVEYVEADNEHRNLLIAWVVATIGLFLCAVIILIGWFCDRRRYKDKIKHLESITSTTTADSSPVVIHTVAASEVLVMKSDDEKVVGGGKPKAESRMESVDDEETKKKKKKKTKAKKKKTKSKSKTATIETTQDGSKMNALSPNGKTRTYTGRTPTKEATKEETSADNQGYPKFQATATGGTEGTAGTAELQIASRIHF